jgi:hypothetical protein
MTFEEVVGVYNYYLDLTDDPDILKILYASVCANFYKGSPVWMIFIGDSGTGKTQLLSSLKDADVVYSASSISSKSMLSGFGTEDNSMLFQLKDKILVVKDISTISEMQAEDRACLFGILRDAYDGYVNRNTGRGQIAFEGFFGVLMAATKSFEIGRKMETMLGERFLYCRLRARNHGAILDKVQQNAARKQQMDDHLRAAAKEFLNNWKMPSETRSLPKSVVISARECATILVTARSAIIRDSYTKEISFPAEVTESPTRVYNSFILFLSALKYLGSEKDDMIRIIHRITVDSIPYLRMRILSEIANGKVKPMEISEKVGIAKSVCDRNIDDMLRLKILTKKNNSTNLEIKDKRLGWAVYENAGYNREADRKAKIEEDNTEQGKFDGNEAD